ncbi:hypothetical protein K788_0006843 [Paraburkholderia caribensis MBA4]|uniref:Uncharacterized protein n=1 Tax=Paraburkholderia caribensis MBA4 TaxID=1323664 RepID=A0A0P0R7T7_9BURK|nr:hypothetical protein K788_0006843 [Paraburkholderia caribensis MBA4]
MPAHAVTGETAIVACASTCPTTCQKRRKAAFEAPDEACCGQSRQSGARRCVGPVICL